MLCFICYIMVASYSKYLVFHFMSPKNSLKKLIFIKFKNLYIKHDNVSKRACRINGQEMSAGSCEDPDACRLSSISPDLSKDRQAKENSRKGMDGLTALRLR